MHITLKNVAYSSALSEETAAFSATIYVDGVRSGSAMNHGTGGPTMITPRELDDRLTAYAKTLPPKKYRDQEYPVTAEDLINNALDDHLDAKTLRRKMTKSVLFASGGKIYATVAMDRKKLKDMLSDSIAKALRAEHILNILPFDEALKIYRQNA
jgi:hypothetical protein